MFDYAKIQTGLKVMLEKPEAQRKEPFIASIEQITDVRRDIRNSVKTARHIKRAV